MHGPTLTSLSAPSLPGARSRRAVAAQSDSALVSPSARQGVASPPRTSRRAQPPRLSPAHLRLVSASQAQDHADAEISVPSSPAPLREPAPASRAASGGRARALAAEHEQPPSPPASSRGQAGSVPQGSTAQHGMDKGGAATLPMAKRHRSRGQVHAACRINVVIMNISCMPQPPVTFAFGCQGSALPLKLRLAQQLSLGCLRTTVLVNLVSFLRCYMMATFRLCRASSSLQDQQEKRDSAALSQCLGQIVWQHGQTRVTPQLPFQVRVLRCCCDKTAV